MCLLGGQAERARHNPVDVGGEAEQNGTSGAPSKPAI
jgi:hypothetical protein